MKTWYLDIPEGHYTTAEIIELSYPKISISGLRKFIKRHQIEKIPIPVNRRIKTKPNEKLWKWFGGHFYYQQWNNKINSRI